VDVEFRRSGERRYAVRILRPGQPALEKDPAPGYDARLPHDIVHLVVERVLGLRQGIFGQAAAGGSGGLFMPVGSEANGKRAASRERRSFAKRSEKLKIAGQRDAAASEAAVYSARAAWEKHRTTGALGSRPSWISDEQITQICDELDTLSARWVRLGVGDLISVNWPTRST
jgi:hypothetical protein